MKKDMTTGSIWKNLLFFSIPIMLGTLLQSLYNTVDGIIVGNFVSENALAAVGTSTVVTLGMTTLGFGMSTGCSIAVGQFFGAGKEKEMRATAATAMVRLGSLGAAMMLLGVLCADFIAEHILGIESLEVRAYAASYLRIYSVGLILMYVYNCISAILRSVGDSKAALYFLIISTVVNVLLDLLFVAVFGWEVAGAAWATVIAQAACLVFSYVYMYRRYEIFRFGLRQLRPERDKLRLCVKLGIPTSLQHIVVACGNIALQRLIDSFGPVSMAAYTVGRTYDHYISVPCLAMFQSMTSFAGQNTGAGRYDRVKRGAFQAAGMAVAGVAVLGVIIYAAASPLAAAFGVSGETQAQAVAYLRFIAVAYPLMAAYLPFNGCFQGCGEPLAATASSIVALSTRVGAAYLMAYAFHVGYSSGWKSYAVGWGCALIYVLIHFYRGKWMTKSIVKTPAQPKAADGAE